MGKVQRGRKKDHPAPRRPTPRPETENEPEPEEPSGERVVTEQQRNEEACQLSFVRITNRNSEPLIDNSEGAAREPASGEHFFFNDVPGGLSLRNAPLYSRKPMPFARCDICFSYSASATISECGHRFCGSCGRITRTGQAIFCQFCRKAFVYYVLNVAADHLARLVLSCRCGFEGTLLEIRIHLSTKGGSCHESRQSLMPLLKQKRSAKAHEEWKQRSQFLNEIVLRDRRSIVPPGTSDPVFEKAEKNPALPHVYLDFEADGLFLGRLYIELREDVVPKTVARFLDLLKDPKGYKGSEIEFMVPNTFFQVTPLSGYGRTIRSSFDDENFKLKHDRCGTLAMTNFGPNSNQSGFYVTDVEMPWRDGANVVFGYVIANHRLVRRICETAREDGSVARRVKIIGCGKVLEWILPSIFSGFELFDSS